MEATPYTVISVGPGWPQRFPALRTSAITLCKAGILITCRNLGLIISWGAVGILRHNRFAKSQVVLV